MADIPAIPDSLRDALRRKARLPADYYGDVIGQIRAAGFTVSGLASLDHCAGNSPASVADQEMRSCRNRFTGTSPEPLAGFFFPLLSAKRSVRQPDAVRAFRDSARQRLTMVQNSAAVISAS